MLDFGLAKLAEPTAAGTASPTALSMLPTITSPMMMTGVGVLLGTAAYMSPEQANGARADQRSDVFSFGCVLCLKCSRVGRRFTEIPQRNWLHPCSSPNPISRCGRVISIARLAEALKRCLEKNPRRRWQAVGDVRVELESIASSPSPVPTPFPSEPPWRHLVVYTGSGVIAGIAIAAAVAWLSLRSAPARVTGLAVDIPTAAEDIALSGIYRDLSITPDGQRVVYVPATERN